MDLWTFTFTTDEHLHMGRDICLLPVDLCYNNTAYWPLLQMFLYILTPVFDVTPFEWSQRYIHHESTSKSNTTTEHT